MHILLLPITYPNHYNHYSGAFFCEQAKALSYEYKIGVIALVGVSVKSLLKTFKLKLGFYRIKNKVDVWLYQYFSFPKMGYFNNFIRLQIGKKIFKAYVKENGYPDLVHVHVFLAGDLAVWIKKTYGIPYIVTEHSSLFLGTTPFCWWHKIILKRVYQNSLANVSVSKALQEALDSGFNIKSVVVPNTVDTDFFDMERKDVKDKKDFVFLNVANLNFNKNHNSLILAFKNVVNSGNNNCRLVIAGDGSEKQKIEDLVSELNLTNFVSLVGSVNKEKIRSLMADSNCFILTSYKETFGVVLIEAMSSGLPVISTKSGGPTDIVTDGKVGLLCDMDVNSIAEAMSIVITKSYDPRYIKAEAFKSFSYSAFLKKITPVYMDSVNVEY